MQIKLNSKPTDSSNGTKKLNLGKVVDQRNAEERQSRIRSENEYDAAREKLMDDFIQDMNDSSISIEVSDEQMKQQEKRYRSLKARRFGMYLTLCGFFVIIMICGIWNTFFKHEYTGEEIALLANYYNGRTNFPEDGVQGYLESNLSTLMGERLQIDSGTDNVNVSGPMVTRINSKSDTLANVYFYFDVNSSNGTQRVDAIIPISWNADELKYYPNGEIMVTPNTSTNDKTDEQENSLLSFEDVPKETNENIASSQTFVDNFFTMLYSGQSVEPYYAGKVTMEANDLEYKGMTNYTLYQETNGNGYNAECEITLKMQNGVSYTTKKYLTLERQGKSWIINAVL